MKRKKARRRCSSCGRFYEPSHAGLVVTMCTHCGATCRKQQSISTLKRLCWKYFSEIVRRDGADQHGYCRCVTCGVRKPWTEMQAGHAIKSRAKGILFDRRIVNPQCEICNKSELRNDLYLLKVVDTYGRETVEEIIRAKWSGGSWSRDELLDLLGKFQVRLAQLRAAQPF